MPKKLDKQVFLTWLAEQPALDDWLAAAEKGVVVAAFETDWEEAESLDDLTFARNELTDAMEAWAAKAMGCPPAGESVELHPGKPKRAA